MVRFVGGKKSIDTEALKLKHIFGDLVSIASYNPETNKYVIHVEQGKESADVGDYAALKVQIADALHTDSNNILYECE